MTDGKKREHVAQHTLTIFQRCILVLEQESCGNAKSRQPFDQRLSLQSESVGLKRR